jgi:putative membrane protein
MHDWNDRMGGGAGGWWWMALVMIVFWGGLIVLAVALIRRPHHTHAAGSGFVARPSRAHDILAERLARGEIDAEEYHSRLDALSHHAPG